MEFSPEVTIGDLISGIASLAAVGSIGLAVLSIRADHLRRKKEATINAINGLRDTYRECFHRLKSQFGGDLDVERAQKLFDEPESQVELANFLAMFEHLAAAANADVFDVDFVNRLSGTFLIGVFEDFRPYIVVARHQQYQQLVKKYVGAKTTRYDEFFALAYGLAKSRGIIMTPLPDPSSSPSAEVMDEMISSIQSTAPAKK